LKARPKYSNIHPPRDRKKISSKSTIQRVTPILPTYFSPTKISGKKSKIMRRE
jgi:hypothetical protein